MRAVLKNEFGWILYAQDVIDTAVSMELAPGKKLMSFNDQASKVFDEAGFNEEQHRVI